MFLLIIWLQGIWLPLHGYSFAGDPAVGRRLHAAPDLRLPRRRPGGRRLADRFGARPFATGGLLIAAASFLALQSLPTDFAYPLFALLIFLNGVGMGLFAAPEPDGIMNSLPAGQRGAGSGMSATFSSSAQVLSIGIFFSLMILGLAASLPFALFHGLTDQGVNAASATRVSTYPRSGASSPPSWATTPFRPCSVPRSWPTLPPATSHYLVGRSFFPSLIAKSFHQGLEQAFRFTAGACILGALASLLRGGKYHYSDEIDDYRPASPEAESDAAVDSRGSSRPPTELVGSTEVRAD